MNALTIICMKNLIPLLVLLFAFSKTTFASSNQQIKYRIQCATSADKDLIEKLSDIPELKSFTLPSGNKIYFSGGYFNKIGTAQARLEEVKAVGFKSAFIRVFKYSNMLSKPVGDQYIENAKKKIVIQEEVKKTVQANASATKVTTKSSQKIYSRAEVEAMKKKAAERKAKAEAAKVKTVKKEVLIEKKEVKVEEKEPVEKKKKPAFIVDEPPVYKVMLGSVKSRNDPFEAVSKLNNEIVYTYEARNEIIYAVGYFDEEEAAQKALPNYIKHASEAKVIGLYKGKVISLQLANQLYEQYHNK